MWEPMSFGGFVAMKSSHVVTFRSSLPVNGLLVIDDIFFIIRSITSGISSPIDEFKLSYMKEGLLRLSHRPASMAANLSGAELA